jgi:chorismate mutase/prephenate dehydratase
MSNEDDLKKIREHIDRLDEQIQMQINERAAYAEQVARIKKTSNDDAIFYRPEREAEVLRRIKQRNQGPLSGEEMARVFREIMSACLALEHPMKIAFLGPEGTYTQAAALKHFGHSVITIPMATIEEVFREVEAGASHYGVVPVENSTEGVISHTLDRFISSPLKVCGEIELRIHHCLMSNVDAIDEVKKVFAHQQSFGQCREWLDANMPNAERIPVSSNAEAARIVNDNVASAAIASESAAQLYDLQIIEKNIEDMPDNTTRFLVIGQVDTPPSGIDKISLLLSAKNKPGALFSLLKPLAKHKISMTRIESRPSHQGMWDYIFFIDIEGHADNKDIAKALNDLEAEAAMFRILGSYPQAVL